MELLFLLLFISSAKEVYFFIRLLVSLFVSRIIQKALNQFAPNLMEEWGTGQGGTHYILVWIQIKKQIQEFFLIIPFLNIARFSVFPHFHQYLALAEVCKLLCAILTICIFIFSSSHSAYLHSVITSMHGNFYRSWWSPPVLQWIHY